MRTKKFLLLIAALLLILATGCGGEDKSADKEVKIGMLKNLNASEAEFNDFMDQISDTFALGLTAHRVTYFDTLNSMLMALESGQVDEVSTYTCVASYLAARNPKIEVLEGHTLEFIDAFCLALRNDETQLYDSAQAALAEMRDDGTLDRLTTEYITSLTGTADPPAVALDNSFAESLKVGVTGDLPPLDLIRADGTPAGFNTAVLAELGRRLERNIEIVQIESGARAAALTSGQVDVIFWAIVPVSEIIPANVDRPEGVELTAPYYRGKIVHIGLKKS